MKQRTGWVAMLLLAFPSAAALAQFSPVTIPGKRFRVELEGEFRNADSRYSNGVTQDIARGFTSNGLGSGFFPTLVASENRIGQIIGNSAYRLNLGQSSANGLVNIGTASIGVSYGLTSRITLFTTVPVVQTRMQLTLRLDSTTADAGFNPNDPALGTTAGRVQTTGFFNELDAALTTLSTKIANGDYDANPADKALAQEALAEGLSLRDGLNVVFNDRDAPFVPTVTSSAGVALTDSISGLQSTLGTLNVSGFSTQPALATNRISRTDLDNFIVNAGGPVVGFPLNEAKKNLLGDIESGVAYNLVDTWNRHGKPGGLRAAVMASMRFPTGTVERNENFLDVGTGTGHLAMRVMGTLDVGQRRVGARVVGGYEYAFPAIFTRRIGTPAQPIGFASRTSNVRVTPGGLLDISLTPFFRLAPTLSIIGGARLRHRGSDKVEFATGQVVLAGVDPGDLAEGTGWGLTSFQAGLSYVSPASLDPGVNGFPVEASWTIEGPVGGSGGIVAKERTMRMQLRLYMSLFK